MGVKVYVSGISGNKEVKKRQQRVFMILESKNIPYDVVDITEPGKEHERDFMQEKSTSNGATVGDTSPRHPLPPQLFNDQDYCGDYNEFDLANEIDTLEDFLKVEVQLKKTMNDVTPKESRENSVAKETAEVIETNGVSSSREMSVESDAKSNGAEQPAEEETAETQEEVDVNGTEKETDASEEFLENEREADD